MVGLVGMWDCVAFDEVAGIKFKDKDGIQIMKDYMASGSFARGKEEKSASASMVFVGNINQDVEVLLKTSSLFDPFPPEMGTDTAFLDRIHCYLPGWEIPKFRPEHFTGDYGFITDYFAEFVRELRKEQFGDALDKYFKLGRNLNQRDTIAVRKMVGGYIKLLYPDGNYTKEDIEEILKISLEMRRRVKEQLKKLGGMEFYDINFSYIDNETFEEHYVSVPEQSGGKLIPEGMCNPGQVYTVSRGKSGMIGVFRLESQALPGTGKFERTGLGSERDAKEASNTAFNYLKANGSKISGAISTVNTDYNHFDFKVIDDAIKNVGSNAKIVEYNNALGLVDFYNKSPMQECDLEQFLKLTMDDGFEMETYIVLKDVHNEMSNPKIISLLKRIAENNVYRDEYSTTVFILSEITVIPKELENYITVFDIPLPTTPEILSIINEFIRDLDIKVEQDVIDDIALSFKGLNEFQIKQILNLAYQDGGCIDKDDKLLILKEKEQFIKKSGMLEIVSYSETVEDIGGLENLKEWLERKAKIFSNLDKAIKFGVDVPKGIMIIGMPGCGKSLTAKATASLFQIPLVRLDVGRLLGKYVGESEENMRKALKLSEAISPCVLWIDEIEKAFAGVGGDGGGNDVTTRLFGQFLTWMQEKENTVFIVATANDISRMPPEFLRKGRFDELFFVDLPNGEERRKIIEIHLKKRNKWSRNIDSIALIKETDGFNGADLEAVVKDTIELAFIEGRSAITTDDLIKTVKDTKSISSTLKEKIKEIKATIEKIDIKPASKEDQKS